MKEAVPFQWRDEDLRAKHGPGVSHPRPEDVTRQWRLRVRLQSGPPMIVTLHARTLAEAKRFAQARWPLCTATPA